MNELVIKSGVKKVKLLDEVRIKTKYDLRSNKWTYDLGIRIYELKQRP